MLFCESIKGSSINKDLAPVPLDQRTWHHRQPTHVFPGFLGDECFFIWKGMESIKWLEVLSAPFLSIVGVLLMVWAVTKAGGFGSVFAASSATKVVTWGGFGAGLTAMVGFWATLSLNIPDFSRYAKSQRDQLVGQAMALPTTMTFYSLGPIAGIMVADFMLEVIDEALAGV